MNPTSITATARPSLVQDPETGGGAAAHGAAPAQRAQEGRIEWYALFSAFLIIVPYATGALQYFYAADAFPLRPRNYLLVVLGLALPNLLRGKPRVGWSAWMFLGLSFARAADAILLDRVTDLEGGNPVMAAAGAALTALAVLCLTTHRSAIAQSGTYVGLAALVICSAVNFWEWANPGAFSTVLGRSAGWLQNSNESAGTITLMLGLVLSMEVPPLVAAAAIVVSGLGTYCSLSRGGALVWLTVVAAYLLQFGRHGARRTTAVVLVFLASVAMVPQLLDLRGLGGEDQNVRSRQEFILGGQIGTLAGDERFALLEEGFRGIGERPLGGFGTGSSWGSPFAPHNGLVGVWLDNGILGFLALAAAFVLLFRECWRGDRRLLAGWVALAIWLLFSHNLLESRAYLLAFMTLSSLAAYSGRRCRRVEQAPPESPAPLRLAPRARDDHTDPDG